MATWIVIKRLQPAYTGISAENTLPLVCAQDPFWQRGVPHKHTCTTAAPDVAAMLFVKSDKIWP